MTKRTHEDVVGTKFGRDWHRRRGEEVCDLCRTAWNEVCRERQRSARERGWVRSRTSLARGVCGYCASVFHADSRQQLFCSRSCFMLHRNRGMSAEAYRAHQQLVVRVAVAPRSAPVTIVTLPKWWGVIISGPCAWCGENFTSTGSGARYCSSRCGRNAAKSARGERFQPSPTLRRLIYERDGWVCQLCLDPVDPDSDPQSDWHPSLDHVVPQSHTLIPDHSAANLRTAHRWCNAVRGDGRYHSDLFATA